MFVSKLVACAALLLVSVILDTEARSHCPDGTTIPEFAEYLLNEVSVRYPHLKQVKFDCIDPLPLGTFTVKTENYVVQHKKAYLTGLGAAKLYKVDWDFRNNVTTAKLYANLSLTSDYESTGKFMFLPMTSSGKLAVYGIDMSADLFFRFKTVVCDNEEYMEIYDVNATPKFGLLHFELKSNTGCSAYDDMMNAALNYNWRHFVSNAQTTKIIGQEMQIIMNRLMKQVPLIEFLKYI